jgi:hypothetical protein
MLIVAFCVIATFVGLRVDERADRRANADRRLIAGERLALRMVVRPRREPRLQRPCPVHQRVDDLSR